MNPSPKFTKTDLSVEYRFKYTLEWISKNKRLPKIDD